jgi:hypothetical protein
MAMVENTNKPPSKDAKKADHASTATHKSLITRNLRLVYGEVASEPVPDRINELLNQLGAAADRQSKDPQS